MNLIETGDSRLHETLQQQSVASDTTNESLNATNARSQYLAGRQALPPRSPANRAASSRTVTSSSQRHAMTVTPGRLVSDLERHHLASASLRPPSSVPFLSSSLSTSKIAAAARGLGAAVTNQCILPTLIDEGSASDSTQYICRNNMRIETRKTVNTAKATQGAPSREAARRNPATAAPSPSFLPRISGPPLTPTPPAVQWSKHDSCRRYPIASAEPLVSSTTRSSSNERSTQTRDELLRLKRELVQKKMMKKQTILSRGVQETAALELREACEDDLGDGDDEKEERERGVYDDLLERKRLVLLGTSCEKRVRFSRPLVTEIRHRPYTRAEDIEKLYFIEEELEELELDRATVDGDQFELSLVVAETESLHGDSRRQCVESGTVRITDADAPVVSVTYTNKRMHLRLEEGGDEVPFTPSDDILYE